MEGAFCWFELSTSDVESAKKLYTELFNWTTRDIPMSATENYTIFSEDEKTTGAVCKLQKDQIEQHVPPNWLVYVAVDNVDAAVAKARELGGNLLGGPFDVMDAGRMAVLQDPTGAVFAIWQANRVVGVTHRGPINNVCWCELATPDPVKATAFYQALFGWRTKPETGVESAEYIEIMNPHPIGGMMPMRGPMWAGVPPHWMIYISVADCNERAAKAVELGAKTCVPPTDIPNVGRFSILTDAQGAYFSIIQLSAARAGA